MKSIKENNVSPKQSYVPQLVRGIQRFCADRGFCGQSAERGVRFLASYFILLTTLIWPISSWSAPAISGNYAAVTGSELLKISVALLFIVLLIIFLSWIIKRLNRANSGANSSMSILACTNLGMKEKMVLVKVGSRILLVGVAAGSVNTLCDFGEQLPEGFSSEGKKQFADLFKNALRSS